MVVISLKQTFQQSSVFIFWKPNRQGYTPVLDDAGVYSKDEVKDLEQDTKKVLIIDKLDLMPFTETLFGKEYLPNTPHVRYQIHTPIHLLSKTDTTPVDDFKSIQMMAEQGQLIERYKQVRSKNIYVVTGKPNVLKEPWTINWEVTADTRREAELLIWKKYGDLYSWRELTQSTMSEFFCFRKAVSFKQKVETVFDGWKKRK
jgi:hypothetical protein